MNPSLEMARVGPRALSTAAFRSAPIRTRFALFLLLAPCSGIHAADPTWHIKLQAYSFHEHTTQDCLCLRQQFAALGLVGRISDLVIARCIVPHTILLVDDNDLYRGMLRSLLELHGYQVITAQNGPEGLACAAAGRIHAALVDLDMPEMDGFEMCRRLNAQQQATGQDVPVWIITGTLRPALARRATAAGALLVLRKPFPIEKLCGELEREFLKRESLPAT